MSDIRPDKDKDQDKPNFQSTQEIIEYIHSLEAKNPDTFKTKTLHWECCKTEEYFREPYISDRRRWSDAAYQGDWDMILKVHVATPAPTRFGSSLSFVTDSSRIST